MKNFNKNLLFIILLMIFWVSRILSLEIAGSSTIQPIMQKIGKLYQEMTGIEVNVKGGGSGYGAMSTIQGVVDIGTCSRDLKDEERRDGLIQVTIGIDGIALIVNSQNPLADITTEQVVGLFTGNEKTWSNLNNIYEEVVIVGKEEGRSTKELFEAHFKLDQKNLPNAFIIGSNAEDLAFVAGDPHAIGYVSIGSAELAVDKGLPVKLLKINGIEASIANVKSGKYPIIRNLNLATKGIPDKETEAFINYVLSVEGQAVVLAEYFIPIN